MHCLGMYESANWPTTIMTLCSWNGFFNWNDVSRRMNGLTHDQIIIEYELVSSNSFFSKNHSYSRSDHFQIPRLEMYEEAQTQMSTLPQSDHHNTNMHLSPRVDGVICKVLPTSLKGPALT